MATKITTHPLALSARDRERLATAGLMTYQNPPPLRYAGTSPAEQARHSHLVAQAREYLSVAYRPHGYAKQLAAEQGIPYVSFINMVGRLRAEMDQGCRATPQANPYDQLVKKIS